MLLPVYTRQGFDTTGVVAPAAQARMLKETRENLEVFFRQELDSMWVRAHDQAELDSFYVRMFSGDILAVAAADSVWAMMPARFVVAARVRSGLRIKTFEGVSRTRAEIEVEVWDALGAEIVWRAEGFGLHTDPSLPDDKFLAEGLRKIYSLLPKCLPPDKSERW